MKRSQEEITYGNYLLIGLLIIVFVIGFILIRNAIDIADALSSRNTPLPAPAG